MADSDAGHFLLVCDWINRQKHDSSNAEAHTITSSFISDLKMNLLPKAADEFRDRDYWDQFFTKVGREAFEWSVSK